MDARGHGLLGVGALAGQHHALARQLHGPDIPFGVTEEEVGLVAFQPFAGEGGGVLGVGRAGVDLRLAVAVEVGDGNGVDPVAFRAGDLADLAEAVAVARVDLHTLPVGQDHFLSAVAVQVGQLHILEGELHVLALAEVEGGVDALAVDEGGGTFPDGQGPIRVGGEILVLGGLGGRGGLGLGKGGGGSLLAEHLFADLPGQVVDGRDDLIFAGCGGIEALRGAGGEVIDLGVQREAAAQGGEAAGGQIIGPQGPADLQQRFVLGRHRAGEGLVHQALVDDGEADAGAQPAGQHVADAAGEIAHVLRGVGGEGQEGDRARFFRSQGWGAQEGEGKCKQEEKAGGGEESTHHGTCKPVGGWLSLAWKI